MIALYLLLGCNPDRPITEIGNPEMDVSARAYSSAPGWVDSANAPVKVDSVWVGIDSLSLVEGCGGSTGPTVSIEQAVELVGGGSWRSTELSLGDYCGASVRLRGDLGEELGEGSVRIAGVGPLGRRFELGSVFEGEIGLSSSEGFAVDPATDSLLIAFDLAGWLAGVDLAALSPDPDGVVRGSASIGTQLDSNLQAAVQLLRDANSDGIIDADELIVPLGSSGPAPIDSDGDGLLDVNELGIHGTDPDLADTDGDRLEDGEEVLLLGTDPLLADTDGGGVDDGTEVAAGTDPLDASDD